MSGKEAVKMSKKQRNEGKNVLGTLQKRRFVRRNKVILVNALRRPTHK